MLAYTARWFSCGLSGVTFPAGPERLCRGKPVLNPKKWRPKGMRTCPKIGSSAKSLLSSRKVSPNFRGNQKSHVTFSKYQHLIRQKPGNGFGTPNHWGNPAKDWAHGWGAFLLIIQLQEQVNLGGRWKWRWKTSWKVHKHHKASNNKNCWIS